MQHRHPSSAVFLVALLLVPVFALFFAPLVPTARAQTAAAPPPGSTALPPPTPEQLDQLLAPIALYPDSLLAQITTACTNPQEILDVNNWLAQNPNLSGDGLMSAAQQQGFDPAFLALVNFPQVLAMMADNIDDYAAIGDAFLADQKSVTDSVQRLRARAYQSGALRSTPQQNVAVEQAGGAPVYSIAPANPQVVYVPVYDPTLVYYTPLDGVPYSPSVITFGLGIGIGALWATTDPWGWNAWGWNWGLGGLFYNRAAWRGWARPYRPPRPWFRPRRPVYASRPGFGGNWAYRPPNYRPQRPVNRPVYTRPGLRPGYNRPGNRPGGTASRPGNAANRPGANRPGGAANRPGGATVNRPGGANGGNRPANPGANRPAQRPQQGTRPSGQARPQARPQSRPAPRPQSHPAPQRQR